MRGFWLVVRRTLFWSYERGSWPYDVMVVAILVFVCLTPRRWFNDAPRSHAAAAPGIQLLHENSLSGAWLYRLDAQVLAPPKRRTKATPELEREIHDILSREVPALRDRTFQIARVSPIRRPDGSVSAYEVTIQTKPM